MLQLRDAIQLTQPSAETLYQRGICKGALDRSLILEYVHRPEVQQDLPGEISSRLGVQAAAFGEAEFWGESLRYLTTIVRWRCASEETTGTLLLANAAGPFSLPEINAYVERFIKERLSLAGFWPLEIAQAIDQAVTEAVAPVRELAAQLPMKRGVPVLDGTLLRLAAYMVARGVEPRQLS